MSNTPLTIVHDPMVERLDELADLAEHWKRWRTRRPSHQPRAIRAAMLMLARELLAQEQLARDVERDFA